MRLSGSDLRLFKVFDAVVRNQGFAAAEGELNISTSTISNHMAALEQRLGVRLCHRGRAGFMLTDKGAKAYEAVQRLLGATFSFNTEIESVQNNRPSEFRIGLVDSVASDPNCRVAEGIAMFKKDLPGVTIALMQEPPNELQAKVRDGEYHCGIGSFPHRISSLDRVNLYTEQHFLYVGSGHPLFGVDESTLTIDKLKHYETVRREYWRDRDDRQEELGAVRAIVNQIEPQLILILGGLFMGLLPAHVAKPWLAMGRLRVLLPDKISYRCNFQLITRKGGEAAEMVNSFMQCCVMAHRGGPRHFKSSQQRPLHARKSKPIDKTCTVEPVAGDTRQRIGGDH